MDPLIAHAIAAREQAVAPYSAFKVGAAIETADGRIFGGCNIESAVYGLTACAERVALWKALSEGARQFKRIALVTDAHLLTPPCGACRQVLWEYCGDIPVLLHSLGGLDQTFTMSELYPQPFGAQNISE